MEHSAGADCAEGKGRSCRARGACSDLPKDLALDDVEQTRSAARGIREIYRSPIRISSFSLSIPPPVQQAPALLPESLAHESLIYKRYVCIYFGAEA